MNKQAAVPNGEIPISFGVHFMIDGYNAPKEPLENKAELSHLLHTIPSKLSMHTISEPCIIEVGPNNKKDPGGVSGFVLIAESHISFHTFPNRGFVTIDIYTCKDELDTNQVEQVCRDAFQYTDSDTHLIQRGSRYPRQNIY